MRNRTACGLTMLLTMAALCGWAAAPADAGERSGFSIGLRLGSHSRYEAKKYRHHFDKHKYHRDRRHGHHGRWDYDRHHRRHVWGRHHWGHRHGSHCRHGGLFYDRHLGHRYEVRTPTYHYRYEKRYIGVPLIRHERSRGLDHRLRSDSYTEVVETTPVRAEDRRSSNKVTQANRARAVFPNRQAGPERSNHPAEGTVHSSVGGRRSAGVGAGDARVVDAISQGLRGEHVAAVGTMRRVIRHGPEALGRVRLNDETHRRIGELVHQYQQRVNRGQHKTDALFMIAALQHLRGEHAAARSSARAARSFGDRSRSTAKLAASIERAIEGGS